MKKFLFMLVIVLSVFALTACIAETTTTTEAAATTTTEAVTETTVTTTEGTVTTADGTETTTEAATTTEAVELAQGVTDTTIKVGNTAATTGFLAFVGVPFNAAIQAVFEEVNEAGGIGGRTIEFVHYDDTFDASLGLTYTETLIEDDEVFALVGHFGTGTVGATLDLIQTTGIPMVYAATGINDLYFYESVGNPVLAVQPIYLTDGRIMAARAMTEDIYGATKDAAFSDTGHIGVLYTNDDAGNSILEGVRQELTLLGVADSRIHELEVTDLTVASAVQLLQLYNVETVILAMNQTPFAYTLSAMYDANLAVPVFSSYVNADVGAVDHTQYSEDRPIYTNAWVDVFSTEGQADVAAYVAAIAAADFLTDEEKTAYYTDAYATAGYIAARIFVEGLMRVEEAGLPLTWENYIAEMEDGPIDVPMGGTVDFSNGMRWGIASMSLLQYSVGDNPATTDVVETDYESFAIVQPIQTLEEIEADE